jgi:hypothetical protein
MLAVRDFRFTKHLLADVVAGLIAALERRRVNREASSCPSVNPINRLTAMSHWNASYSFLISQLATIGIGSVFG